MNKASYDSGCLCSENWQVMPSPSADPKFSLIILKFLNKLNFLKYTQLCLVHLLTQNLFFTLTSGSWRNGEDVGLVYQGSAVRAPPQEIFHSNSGIAVLQKAWNSALDYSKNIIIIIINNRYNLIMGHHQGYRNRYFIKRRTLT